MKTTKILIIGFTLLSLVACMNKKKVKDNASKPQNNNLITINQTQMQAVGISLGKVEQRNLNNAIRVNGQLALNPQDRADVTSLAQGMISRILVIEGSHVSKGQTLALITNTQIVELQKNYLVASKEKNNAQQEYLRQKELSSQGAGVQKTLSQAQTAYEIANAQVQGIAEQLRQLYINPAQVAKGKMVTHIPIKSPISGIVDKIKVNTGSYVDMQSVLMNIINNANLHCDLKIFEKDIQYVKVGQKVDMQLVNQKDIHLEGTIYETTSSFESETKAILVHAKLTQKPKIKLMPDMYVTCMINTGRRTVEAVANDAIESMEGKKYIFQLVKTGIENKEKIYYFKKVEVITGTTELGYTQITPVKPIEPKAVIVSANAFYISSMLSSGDEE